MTRDAATSRGGERVRAEAIIGVAGHEQHLQAGPAFQRLPGEGRAAQVGHDHIREQ